jgi:hypothetical protein
MTEATVQVGLKREPIQELSLASYPIKLYREENWLFFRCDCLIFIT